MIKILAALALTIVVLLALMFVCYLMTYIPFVKLASEIDENDSIIKRTLYGLAFITACIFTPVCLLFPVLVPLCVLFIMLYDLL